MYSHEISVSPYHGSVVTTELLSSKQTLVLNDFGPRETGTLSDDDGVLSDQDDGLSTFNGHPINYLGSGTATPGVDLAGATVPLGASKSVIVFEANGSIYFHFPDGEPNLLGAVALVVDIKPVSSTVFTPVCFAAGTAIRTVTGDMPVENLRAGDTVLDWFGVAHEVVWAGAKRLPLPAGSRFDKWRPVRIAAGAFREGRPERDTWVSQQHRIYVDGLPVAMLCGEDAALAPARKLLNGSTICLEREWAEVEYWHILCARHVILVANGMPAESLLAEADPANPEHRDLFDELRGLLGWDAPPMQLAVPEMPGYAAYGVAQLRLC